MSGDRVGIESQGCQTQKLLAPIMLLAWPCMDPEIVLFFQKGTNFHKAVGHCRLIKSVNLLVSLQRLLNTKWLCDKTFIG